MRSELEEIGDHWRDDAFDRRAYALYLTHYLRGKVLGAGAIPKPRPFTMAIDANWGSGKTFFVQRWVEDLRDASAAPPRHTVVTFDAWAADYAADPLVAFMSELRAELARAVKEGGLAPAAKVKATGALKAATKSVRRLAFPVVGLVAKGVLKKVSGIDLNEALDELGLGDSSESMPAADQREAMTLETVVPTKQAEAALDRLFTVQMSEHAKRKQAIEDFRLELGTVLDVLGSRDGYSAPLFVVIDELDRCKPSFAVGLLEAVKHIFCVPGVCVVISTNMDQLAHTVKAVYGEGFDARAYLQRFFDAIYALPRASGPRLLEVMLKDRPIFSNGQRCKWAFPRSGFQPDGYGAGAAGVLGWIFEGLKLDLRSQRQVLEIMEAAALGVPAVRKIHVPWLAVVCGLWHSNRSAFHEVEAQARVGKTGEEAWNRLGFDAVRRTYFLPDAFPGSSTSQVVSLKEICMAYCARASANLTELEARHGANSRSFTAYVVDEICLDRPYSFNPQAHYSTALMGYFELVRTAGHFIGDEINMSS